MKSQNAGKAQGVQQAGAAKTDPASIKDLRYFSTAKGRALTLNLHHPVFGALSLRVGEGRGGPQVQVYDADLAAWAPGVAGKLPKLNHAEIKQLLPVLKGDKAEEARQAGKALELLLKRHKDLGGPGEARSLETLVALRNKQRDAYEASKGAPAAGPSNYTPPTPAWPFPGSGPRNDGIPSYDTLPDGAYWSLKDGSYILDGKPIRLNGKPDKVWVQDHPIIQGRKELVRFSALRQAVVPAFEPPDL